ncbi:DUF7097 family protein [Halorientalis marina]|uniref:DUF7097 family protein n=1 Tax=Halorientalis marina TaxID=2931976 RepID=UPI001FF158A7|nr:hypothetical protein [Halorientalis marina]
MAKTPRGTSVGVDDPYDYVDRCDHLTDEGRCRFAVEHGDRDPAFADELSAEDFRCPVAGDADTEDPDGPWDWGDCPHFRCRDHRRECVRCGLDECRMAHSDERPLLEEHHLSYRDGATAGDGDPSHEITVYLCRWCHAKVHDSWARIDDDAAPDPEALAEREGRRSREQAELDFSSAADRYEPGDTDG